MDDLLNYYNILEITEDASQEVIKAAYKALVKKYHPDVCNNKVSKNKNIEDIIVAYEVLSDENKRNQYNQKLEEAKQRETQNKETDYERNSYFNNTSEPKETVKNSSAYPESFTDCENEDKKDNSSLWGTKVGKFFCSIGKEIEKSFQENRRIIDNAYIEGMAMDYYSLVRCFKKESSIKRIGYARALEEAGLLEKNNNGGYKATSKFKYYE